jgi:hypothetical protein
VFKPVTQARGLGAPGPEEEEEEEVTADAADAAEKRFASIVEKVEIGGMILEA